MPFGNPSPLQTLRLNFDNERLVLRFLAPKTRLFPKTTLNQGKHSETESTKGGGLGCRLDTGVESTDFGTV